MKFRKETEMKITNTISLTRIISTDEGYEDCPIIKAYLADGEEGEARLIEFYKQARAKIGSIHGGNGEEVRLTAKLVYDGTINNNLDMACSTRCDCPISMNQNSPETEGADKVRANQCIKDRMSLLVHIFEDAVYRDRVRRTREN